MTLNIILFWFFAIIAVLSAFLMITRKNPVLSALYLILTFGSLAGLYLTLNAQFLAVIQIIVYAGAIMVLFLFVIMLINPEHEKGFFEDNPKLKWLAIFIGVIIFFQLGYIFIVGIPSANITPEIQKSIEVGKVETIGRELYTKYIIPIEAAAFILLAATVGALVLAKKKFE